MLTTDLSLRLDPAYEKISRRFYEHPDQFADAFARAWFKLTHRDMGPIAALSRPVRAERNADLAGPDSGGQSSADRREGHGGSEDEDLRVRPLRVAAGFDGLGFGFTFRGSDKRGGANGARIRLARRRIGSQPAGAFEDGARRTRSDSDGVQCGGFRRQEGFACRRHGSGGHGGVEKAAKAAGVDRDGSVHAGARMDASQEQTDAMSFVPLEPRADGFRNYLSGKQFMLPEEALIDRAQLLRLTAPEMTVLVGGLRVLGANVGQSTNGVFTARPGTLTNDFFVNLLDMRTEWEAIQRRRASTKDATARRSAARGPHARRSDLRFARAASCRWGSLCGGGCQREVCPRLRGGLDQSNERRPLRPSCLILGEQRFELF